MREDPDQPLRSRAQADRERRSWVSHHLRRSAENGARGCPRRASRRPARTLQRSSAWAFRTSARPRWLGTCGPGEPVCDAVVWQCARAQRRARVAGRRRGGARARPHRAARPPALPCVEDRSGIIENIPAARRAADRGDLRLGTIDSWWSGRSPVDGSSAVITPTRAARSCSTGDHVGCRGVRPVWHRYGMAAPGDRFRRMLWHDRPRPASRPRPCPSTACWVTPTPASAQGCFERGMAKATLEQAPRRLTNVATEFVPSTHGLSSSLSWRWAALPNTCSRAM